MTYRTMSPDQQQLYLAALKGIVANPKLMGSTRKTSASKAVKLAEQIASDAAR